MEKFSAILLSAIFVCSLCGWVYFLIGAFKVVVNKDRSFLQFTTSFLIISGMLSSLFFLVLRLINLL
jgi:hypothetical protein